MDWEQEEKEWKEIAEHFKNLPTSTEMFKYEVVRKPLNQEQNLPFYKKDWFKLVIGSLSIFISILLLFCDIYIIKNYVNLWGNFFWSLESTLKMGICLFFALVFLVMMVSSMFYSLNIFFKHIFKDI